MFYSHFLPKALRAFLFPPLLATCPHHVSVTLTGVSLQADNIRFIFAVARLSVHITFIVSCAVYRLFYSSIIHSHRVMMKLARPDTTKPHTSLRQVKHPVLVLTPGHASVRPPYSTRQQMCFLEKASGTYTHTMWQGVQFMALLQGVQLMVLLHGVQLMILLQVCSLWHCYRMCSLWHCFRVCSLWYCYRVCSLWHCYRVCSLSHCYRMYSL